MPTTTTTAATKTTRGARRAGSKVATAAPRVCAARPATAAVAGRTRTAVRTGARAAAARTGATGARGRSPKAAARGTESAGAKAARTAGRAGRGTTGARRAARAALWAECEGSRRALECEWDRFMVVAGAAMARGLVLAEFTVAQREVEETMVSMVLAGCEHCGPVPTAGETEEENVALARYLAAVVRGWPPGGWVMSRAGVPEGSREEVPRRRARGRGARARAAAGSTSGRAAPRGGAVGRRAGR
eukprot:TRINITY_DN1801_c0_g1_i1.p1 TRINITY_DN1801_c0_g1~~TRINITY_DN1801_c0_g1_i1.p1  ORF type:complete len:246 (+),score=62.12 TRINITY_DN1801_c0_g1_i1:74-811(+)